MEQLCGGRLFGREKSVETVMKERGVLEKVIRELKQKGEMKRAAVKKLNSQVNALLNKVKKTLE